MSDSSKTKQEDADIPGIDWPRPPQAPDQGLQQAHKAMRLIIEAGFRARLAGGCVRDRILGAKPKDYDIASDAKPEQICLIFEQKGIKVVPTGIDHGTVTVVLAGKGIEVTTLRRDVATDGRHAVVAFGTSYREDAERRDFTMNALFEDLDGKVYDYFHGIDDLQKGILRFVGDPVTRMREDYLRILRLFRFWARFEFEPAAATLEAIAQEAPGLSRISQERITSELLLLLSEDAVVAPLKAMEKSGVLALCLSLSSGKADLEGLAAYKSIRKEERALCRLATLIAKHRKEDELLSYGGSLRLSRQQQLALVSLREAPSAEVLSSKAQTMDYLDQLEKAWTPDTLLPIALPALALLYPEAGATVRALSQFEEQWGGRRRCPLPLAGAELMKKLDLKPGPELGELLKELKRSFREGEWTSAAEGLRKAREYLGSG